MKLCLDDNPRKRPTASQLYKKFKCTNINLHDNDYFVSEEKRRMKISQLPKT